MVLASYGVLLVLLAAGAMLRKIAFSPTLLLALGFSVVNLGVTAVYWGNLTRGRLPLEMVWLPFGVLVAWELLQERLPGVSGRARG